MEYKNIDKEIYHLPEIKKRLRPIAWPWYCIAIGVVGVVLYGREGLSEIVSSLMLGLAIFGALTLVMLVCYYLFGDSRAPYLMREKRLLERTYNYHALRDREALVQAVESGSLSAINKVKGYAYPDLELVCYSDKEETLFYCQVKEGATHQPLTDIVFIQK